MLSCVSPGASFIIETYFKEQNGDSFVATKPPTYTMRTPEGALVLSGAAQQDYQVPSRWFATVTLPESTPIFPQEKKYSLTWHIFNKQQKRTNVEFFNVSPVLEDYSYIENDKVVLDNNPFRDHIILPKNLDITDLSIKVLDGQGNVYLSGLVNPEPVATYYDKVKYSFSSPPIARMIAGNSCNRPFIIQWNYKGSGEHRQEFHFLYVISAKVLLFMNDLRRFIDRARNEDIINQLQYTDVDLVHWLLRGIDRINMANPSLTNYTICNMPNQFNIALTYAAAWEGLSAQLLAEGVSNFELSGQSVSLSVDRTPALEGAFSKVDSWLNDNLPKIKNLTIRQSSMGVLGISLGVTNNTSLSGAQAMNSIRQAYLNSANMVGTMAGYLAV